MKTSVATSSIQSYDHLKAHGMADKQRQIVAKMEHGKVYSRRQLAVRTGLETSCVAGRCNELIADDVLITVGHIKCPITGREVEGLMLAPQQMAL